MIKQLTGFIYFGKIMCFKIFPEAKTKSYDKCIHCTSATNKFFNILIFFKKTKIIPEVNNHLTN